VNRSPLVAPIIERLAGDGFAIAEHFFAPTLCLALKAEAEALATDPAAREAGIGAGERRQADQAIRRARIRWMDGSTTAQAQFLREADALRVALNEALFLGLFAFEAQLALTPAGGFYKRHLDSFQGGRNRVVSLVAYLNDGWRDDDGGFLRVWPPERGGAEPAPNPAAAIDIAPRCGTMALMLSEDVPHEVLPCRRPRTSIAGWFRINAPDNVYFK